jgi:tetratricopeptide (TPR) repeat protein
MRLDRADEAVEIFDRNKESWRQLNSDVLRARLMAFSSSALRKCGDIPRSEAALQEAIGYAICTDDTVVSGEVGVRQCLLLWGEGNLEDAKGKLTPALASSSHVLRCTAQELLGLMAASEGRFHEQLTHLEAAWSEISLDVSADSCLAANVLMNLSISAVELNRGDIVWQIAQRRDLIDWRGEFGSRNYMILENMAWSRALAGDHLGAFSLLRQAANSAPSKPWELQAFVARSFLAREMGEKLFAQEEYEHSLSLAKAINWNATRGEERSVLLELIKLVAAVDANEARRIMDKISGGITSRMDVNCGPASDQRRRAFELMTNGIVSYHEGKTADAERDLTAAFDIWVRCGYKWRATQASVYLADISTDPRFRSYLLENGPTFPNSWLAARARQAALKGPDVRSMDGVRCIAV